MATCAQECDYECTDTEHIKICSGCGNYISGKANRINYGRISYYCSPCFEEDED